MISDLALDYNVTPVHMTHHMQEWQVKMGRMMQEQATHKRGSFDWDLIQANIDAIHRAINMVDTNTPVTVRLLI